MKQLSKCFFPAIVALFFGLNATAQTGFYKNFWGLQDLTRMGYPIVTSLDKVHGGGYILTTVNQIDSNASYLRLDASFRKVWATSYAISPTGFLNRAIELDDFGFVGIYRYDFNNYCFTKQDASGHPVFSNYYHTASSTNFSTNTICKSSSHDSGFVVTYTGCELRYGIAKFNKSGDVEWCYDYAADGYSAQTYDLINGINRGYITTGLHRNASTGHMAAVVAHFNNDGSVLRAKEYILDSSKDSYMDNPLAAVDNHYYTLGNTYAATTDRCLYLSQLDSSLNMTKCWKIVHSDASRIVSVENITSLSDSTIVLNGTVSDSTGGMDRKAFVMRFNPKGAGSIMWSKNWNSPDSISTMFSRSNTGLFANGNDDLVLSLSGNYDGPTISGMDKMGSGLCNTTDEPMIVTAHSGFGYYNAAMTQRSIALLKYSATMTEVTLPYKDTLLCGSLPLEVSHTMQENTHTSVDLLMATHHYDGITLKNLTDNVVEADVYSISGQLLAHLTISPFATIDQLVAVKGIYVIRARSNNSIDIKKVLVD